MYFENSVIPTERLSSGHEKYFSIQFCVVTALYLMVIELSNCNEFVINYSTPSAITKRCVVFSNSMYRQPVEEFLFVL